MSLEDLLPLACIALLRDCVGYWVANVKLNDTNSGALCHSSCMHKYCQIRYKCLMNMRKIQIYPSRNDLPYKIIILSHIGQYVGLSESPFRSPLLSYRLRHHKRLGKRISKVQQRSHNPEEEWSMCMQGSWELSDRLCRKTRGRTTNVS